MKAATSATEKSPTTLFPDELKLIRELASQGVNLEALRVQLLMQSFMEAGLHKNQSSKEGLAAIKENIGILFNSPNFFQIPEAQEIFGTLVGVFLSNPELLKHLSGKNIPEELKRVLFNTPQSKSAATSSGGDSKLILGSLLWALKSGNKGDDEFSIWRREISKIAILKIIQVLKSQGFDINQKFGKGTSLLFYAIASSNLEGMEILFAERDESSFGSLKELVLAIAMADNKMFQALQAKKEFAEVINSPELLEKKLQTKNEELFLCALGLISPHTREIIAMTTEEKIKAIGDYLKQDKKGVNKPLQFGNEERRLPLSIAITNKCEEEVVEFLLDNGANIHEKCLDIKYHLNLSPLSYAMQGSDSIYINLFLKKGSITIDELVPFQSDSMTILAFSAQLNNVDMVRHLLAREANPDSAIVVNTRETTPLKTIVATYAADGGDDEIKVQKQTAILKAMISFSSDLDKKFTWDLIDSLAQMTLEEAFDMRCSFFKSEKIKEYAQEVKAAFAERRLGKSDEIDSPSAAAASAKDLPEATSFGAMMLRAIAKNNVEAVRAIMESLGDNQQFGDINYLSYAIRDNKIDVVQLMLSHPKIKIDKSKVLEDLKFCNDETFAALNPSMRFDEKTQRGFSENEIADLALYRIAHSIFLKRTDNKSLFQKIEQLKTLFPSQNLQKLVSKRFEFINSAEKKKITILSSAIEASNLEVVRYLLNEVAINPDEPCFEKGLLESPLLKCIKLNASNPSKDNGIILGLLIAHSKILATKEGCAFILQSCKETMNPLPVIVNQAITARKEQLNIASQAAELASFNPEDFGVVLISAIIRNIEALKDSENPALLGSIKEKLDILNFKHPFTEIINSNKLGFIIGAAIINPKLREIISSYDLEAINLILSDRIIENNDRNKKCLVNALNLCLQNNSDPKSFEAEAVKVASEKIATLLPQGPYKIDPVISESLVHSVGQCENPSLIRELLKKEVWNVNDTFKIKNGESVNLLTMIAAFGNIAAVELLLSQENIILSEASIIGTLKTCSKEVFEALVRSPKLNLKGRVKYWESYKRVAEVVNSAVSALTQTPLTSNQTDEIIKKLSSLSSEKAKNDAINKIFTLCKPEVAEEQHTFLSLAIDMNCESRLIKFLLENGASLEQAKEQRGKDLSLMVVERYKKSPNTNDREILISLIKASENLSDLQAAKKLFQESKINNEAIKKEFLKKEKDLTSSSKEESFAAAKDLDKIIKEIDGDKSSKKPKKSPEEIEKLREQKEANRLKNLAKTQERKAAKEAEEEKLKKLQEAKKLAEEVKQLEKEERLKQEQKIKAQQKKEAEEERKRIAAEKVAAARLEAAKKLAAIKEAEAAARLEAAKKEAEAAARLAAIKEAEAAAREKEERIKKCAQSEVEADIRSFEKRNESFIKAGKTPEEMSLFVERKVMALKKFPEGNILISKQIEIWERSISPSVSPKPKEGGLSQLSEAAAGHSQS